jgi:hypothetical protein
MSRCFAKRMPPNLYHSIGKVTERLHPGKHDVVPAPQLAPDSELEHMLIAGVKSLWYGITFPIRIIATAIMPLDKELPPPDKELPPPDKLMDQHKPHKGEDVEELHDALAPSHDQLRLERFWWFLEWIPLKHKKGKTAHLSYNANDYHWMYVFRSYPILRHVSCFPSIRLCRIRVLIHLQDQPW